MTNERRWRIAWLGGPVIGIVDGKAWDELLADYDLTTGHVWTLVLAWLALGPFAIRRLRDHVHVPGAARAG